MILVSYPVTALAESDAQGTNASNIVADAIISAIDADGNTATLYDDAAGTNPETTKKTDSKGQKDVYIEPGKYSMTLGDSTRDVVVSADDDIFYNTFTDAQSAQPVEGAFVTVLERNSRYVVQTSGYSPLSLDITFSNGLYGRLQVEDSIFSEQTGAVVNEPDSTSSLQNALDDCRNYGVRKVVITGSYNVTGLNIPQEGITLTGINRWSSVLTNTTANQPTVTATAFLNGWEVRNLTLDRSVTATNGGNGLNSSDSCNRVTIDNLLIKNNFIGAFLRATGFSRVSNCDIESSVSHGILMQNTSTNNALQWNLNTLLLSSNGGAGLFCSSITGPVSVSLGAWEKINTNLNGSFGISVVGANAPIFGVRILSGFLGKDGDDEIFLDTYGDDIIIADTYTELAGIGSTGTGAGLNITANNGIVNVNGFKALAHSENGLQSSCDRLYITGSSFNNNGQALTGGARSGIRIFAGIAHISCTQSGNKSGTTQQFGIASDVDTLSVSCCDLENNDTNPTFGVFVNSQFVANIPTSVNTIT